MTEPGKITGLLIRASQGDRAALEEVVPLVYDDLRVIARRSLARERSGHTLSTTALAHEAYLKLAGLNRIQYQDREHFFAVAARVIRQILVTHAVRRRAHKRGGDRVAVPLEAAEAVSDPTGSNLMALHDALERLEQVSERQARVVECRFFAGMSIAETAKALRVAPATVKRDWAFARAWLNSELS